MHVVEKKTFQGCCLSKELHEIQGTLVQKLTLGPVLTLSIRYWFSYAQITTKFNIYSLLTNFKKYKYIFRARGNYSLSWIISLHRVLFSLKHRDRPPQQYWSQGGAGSSIWYLSVEVPSTNYIRFSKEPHRFLLLKIGRLYGGGRFRRSSAGVEKQASSERRCSWSYWRTKMTGYGVTPGSNL